MRLLRLFILEVSGISPVDVLDSLTESQWNVFKYLDHRGLMMLE